MKKIISLFVRNYDGDRLVRDEIVPGAEWVVAGEGVATVKFPFGMSWADGAPCRPWEQSHSFDCVRRFREAVTARLAIAAAAREAAARAQAGPIARGRAVLAVE